MNWKLLLLQSNERRVYYMSRFAYVSSLETSISSLEATSSLFEIIACNFPYTYAPAISVEECIAFIVSFRKTCEGHPVFSDYF